jgi:signal transduction histidine kinase
MRRDWVMVALLIPAVILEAIFRTDLDWWLFAMVFGLLPLFLLPWRRTHPLLVVAIGFVMHVAGDIALLFGAENSAILVASLWVLVLPYALVRWGSGKEAMLGLAVVVATHVHSFEGPLTALIGVAIMLLPAEIGYAVRHGTISRSRRMDEVRLREREQLARELHDTVAHYVSAIAIQAQAGQAVAATNPAAASQALVVIEEAASRTLAEMRTMVGALRQGEEPDLAPQRGVADIRELTATAGNIPVVDVDLSGDLDGLRPSVEAALYRIAQESITNALRHAHRPTRIEVAVSGDDEAVTLTVNDDGDVTPLSTSHGIGFGLDGMTERVALLGGTLAAGPSSDKGWTVTARLPKYAVTR